MDEKGVILAGHTRLKAAQELEYAKVPVHVAVGLTAAQAKAYRLMDNRSHEEAEWDTELIGIEMEDLPVEDFDLSLTGFDFSEIEKILTPSEVDDGDRNGSDQTGELQEQYKILVECDSEQEQAAALESLTAEGYTCRALIS